MHWLFEWSGYCHPDVQSWFLVGNPWAVFGTFLGYYAAVAVALLYMRNKPKPVDVHRFSLVHNFLMVCLSLYMAVEIARQVHLLGLGFMHNVCDVTERGLGLSRVIYIFYLSKIPEWIDTLIMILKKNSRQVTFLHLYHHGSIFVYCWLGVRHIPGADCYLAALLNSSVHVVMYSYYFSVSLSRDLKAIQTKKNPLIKLLQFAVNSFLCVKPYITMMQLAQFFIILGRDLVIIFYYGKSYSGPTYMAVLDTFYMLSMVALFLNFFIVNFIRKRVAQHGSGKPEKTE